MNHQPRKRFGQNFLHDELVIDTIIRAIGPGADQHLVEIGPGHGALTRHLAETAGQLDLIELDRDLVAELQSRFAGRPNLRIHSADALRFDFRALAAAQKLRVVGNLPYNISTPLMFHLFEQAAAIVDMHFMLQKEVVDRLCAEPGGDAYGRLSVMAQFHCRAEYLFEVPPESFFPAPKVTSAIVRLLPHPAPPVPIGARALGRIVQAAFAQRRKTLRNGLKGLLDDAAIEAAGVTPSVRAETLDLAAFARLAAQLPAVPGD